jgi:hypothetical protein
MRLSSAICRARSVSCLFTIFVPSFQILAVNQRHHHLGHPFIDFTIQPIVNDPSPDVVAAIAEAGSECDTGTPILNIAVVADLTAGIPIVAGVERLSVSRVADADLG